MNDTDLIARFCGPNATYYARIFGVIEARAGLALTFNSAAAVFGPLWAGMRGLSFLFLLLCFLDLGALSQVTSGLWGNTDGAGLARIAQLEATIASRRDEAGVALAKGNAEAAATASKLADNLQKAVDAARTKAALSADGAGSRCRRDHSVAAGQACNRAFCQHPL
jgi:glycine betaine/proline transport system permease protein